MSSSSTKRPYILGIDPGLSGALCILDVSSNPNTPFIVNVWDTPIVKDGPKNVIDHAKLGLQLAQVAGDVELCVLEKVHSTPNDGHVGAFSFGRTFGTVIGLLAATMTPIFFVEPGVWKNCLGLSYDKDQSRQLATKLFPTNAHLWTRKKDDGRAESVLLAHFGKRFY